MFQHETDSRAELADMTAVADQLISLANADLPAIQWDRDNNTLPDLDADAEWAELVEPEPEPIRPRTLSRMPTPRRDGMAELLALARGRAPQRPGVVAQQTAIRAGIETARGQGQPPYLGY
jgi:hypothetical protein